MVTIDPKDKLFTVINVFTVDPDKQEALIEELAGYGEILKTHASGYIASCYHRGVDGDRVANYAQWRSRDDYERAMAVQEVKAAIGHPPKNGRPDWHAYEVAVVIAA